MKIINLLDYGMYSIEEKIHFYSNYYNIDYIIVHMENNETLKSLKLMNEDVIIKDCAYRNYECKKETKYINFFEQESFEKLFSELYAYLSEE